MNDELIAPRARETDDEKKKRKRYGPARRQTLDGFRLGMHVEIEGVHFRIEKVTGKRVVLNAISIQRKETV